MCLYCTKRYLNRLTMQAMSSHPEYWHRHIWPTGQVFPRVFDYRTDVLSYDCNPTGKYLFSQPADEPYCGMYVGGAGIYTRDKKDVACWIHAIIKHTDADRYFVVQTSAGKWLVVAARTMRACDGHRETFVMHAELIRNHAKKVEASSAMLQQHHAQHTLDVAPSTYADAYDLIAEHKVMHGAKYRAGDLVWLKAVAGLFEEGFARIEKVQGAYVVQRLSDPAAKYVVPERLLVHVPYLSGLFRRSHSLAHKQHTGDDRHALAHNQHTGRDRHATTTTSKARELLQVFKKVKANHDEKTRKKSRPNTTQNQEQN